MGKISGIYFWTWIWHGEDIRNLLLDLDLVWGRYQEFWDLVWGRYQAFIFGLGFGMGKISGIYCWTWIWYGEDIRHLFLDLDLAWGRYQEFIVGLGFGMGKISGILGFGMGKISGIYFWTWIWYGEDIRHLLLDLDLVWGRYQAFIVGLGFGMGKISGIYCWTWIWYGEDIRNFGIWYGEDIRHLLLDLD